MYYLGQYPLLQNILSRRNIHSEVFFRTLADSALLIWSEDEHSKTHIPSFEFTKNKLPVFFVLTAF